MVEEEIAMGSKYSCSTYRYICTCISDSKVLYLYVEIHIHSTLATCMLEVGRKERQSQINRTYNPPDQANRT